MQLNDLIRLFEEAGAQRVLAKKLAPNDNSKNQIYLGPSLSALHILPSGAIVHPPGRARNILWSQLDLHWMSDEGNTAPAPQARLILYPQYPEVRLGSALAGCPLAPSKLIGTREEGRTLFLGIRSDGSILAYAAPRESPVSKGLEELPDPVIVGVFVELPIHPTVTADNQELLLEELAAIHEKGWIDSKKLLPDGSTAPYRAQNGGGYTLEAELGITPNGKAEPDYLGWEVKQHRVSAFDRLTDKAITLFTPEPNGGFYAENDIREFVKEFGYPDQRGREDRLNFGGVFRNGRRDERTGLTLHVTGFDAAKNTITDTNGSLRLVSDSDVVAASWAFTKLMEHWKRKHSRAVYVPSQFRKGAPPQYWYGNRLRLCTHTDFQRFLSAVVIGSIYYDPGIKVEQVSQGGKPKKRSQFRIHSKDIPALYEQVNTVDL